ncbi:hypothetical protein [Carnobacterium maltaromaticum]|uniref:hypothetical protein n=1 Tax=Carnobacterium maltaromaticum TaxID=2751 RepID=UPI0012F78B1D|nr:hypothetical protein [Carnobacterium maltaromaticum]
MKTKYIQSIINKFEIEFPKNITTIFNLKLDENLQGISMLIEETSRHTLHKILLNKFVDNNSYNSIGTIRLEYLIPVENQILENPLNFVSYITEQETKIATDYLKHL